MVRTFLWLVACLLIAAGCGKSSEPTANQSGNAFDQSAIDFAKLPESTPDRAVFNFLEAVRTGNDQRAAALLTPLARQKTAEMQMVVAPPGSPTAKFSVGKIEYVTPQKDGAHVACSWTDITEGQSRTDQIIWVLRKEAEGWRIAGMVTKVFADQPPLVLNFEDPEDMLRKQQLLNQEATPTGAEAPKAQVQPQATRMDQNRPAPR